MSTFSVFPAFSKLSLGLLCTGLLLTPTALAMTPPVAEKHPHEMTLHGDRRVDPYFWLREQDNPKVLNYLQAENRYTAHWMADTQPLQEQLYNEMVGYLTPDDQSVPRQKGDYFYYSRTEAGKNYRIYCRRKGSMTAPEEILLDLNAEAKGHDYLALGLFKLSPNQRYLAYALDTSGAESYTLAIKDLQTGRVLKDRLEGAYYSAEWAADNQTLFYNTIDAANRPDRLWRHTLGQAQRDDVLVYHEPDERFNVEVSKTSSGDYLILHLESNTTSENHFIPAQKPTQAPQLMQARRQNIQYDVEHHGDHWILSTNDGARGFRVMQAPLHQPDRAHWQELIPERPQSQLDSIQVFKDFLTLSYRSDARLFVQAYDFQTQERWEVPYPDAVASIWPTAEQDYGANRLRVDYASLVTPWSVFDYDLRQRQLSLKKQDKVQGYVAGDYVMERHHATAPDGVKVPLTLVYKKGLQKNGQNPTYLYSYGAYGVSTDPDFTSSMIPLLNRGFVYAIAHIRGGLEMGREWYDNGKLLHKKNSFTDFIAVGDYLVQSGFTQPQRLVIEGGSAGGLLMGAVTNLRPDLFRAVIADVPFVDALNTMLDASLPLTVTEYEEWGNPNEKPYYDYIKSYSPYDNVRAQAYPYMLVLGGLNDPRVKYWEPAKLMAKLRTHHTGDQTLLLKTNMAAGHSGASGRYEALKETAFKQAFLLKALGLSQP